jgi:CBS domain-containing protein
MTTDVASVSPRTPLKDVGRLLIERRISGVPVVDEGGAVLGVVSEEDFLFKEQGTQRKRPFDGLLDPGVALDRLKHDARDAGEAMTTPAVTVGSAAPVAEAARTMIVRGVKRLPVVDGGKLVGILSRSDLVRAFARTDEEIEREIREDVLVRTHWISPANVAVFVRDGKVTLHGEVETPALAESLRYFVERVPGVVSVEAQLRVPKPVA